MTLPPLEKLNLLQDNLQELHSVSVQGIAVANWSSTRIYNASYGWGRLWTWIYKGVDLIICSRREERLARALEKTDALFQTNLVNIREYHRIYEQNLKIGDKEGRLSVAWDITRWNRAIAPLIGIVQKVAYAASAHLPETQIELKKSHALQELINNEGKFPKFPSIDALKRLSTGVTIHEEELLPWIKELNENRDQLTSSQLHNILEGIVGIFGASASLPRLENWLILKGCTLLTSSDPQIKEWKSTLSEGMVFQTGNTQITLGKPLYPKPTEDDHRLVFEVRENSNVVFVAAAYLAEMGIQKGSPTNSQSVKISYIDPEGRFALLEKLIPWEMFPWSDASTQNVMNRLVEFINEQITTKKTYDHLTTRSWLISPDSLALLCTKRVERSSKLNPFHLRDFARNAANGNHLRYIELIEKSGLSALLTPFFNDLLKALLDEGSSNKNIVQPLIEIHHLNESYMNHDALLRQCLGVRGFIMTEAKFYDTLLESLGPITDENKARVKSAMCEVYAEQQGLGTFWEGYVEEVYRKLSSIEV